MLNKVYCRVIAKSLLIFSVTFFFLVFTTIEVTYYSYVFVFLRRRTDICVDIESTNFSRCVFSVQSFFFFFSFSLISSKRSTVVSENESRCCFIRMLQCCSVSLMLLLVC